MKVPKSYEGKLVGIHLARPVYMFEYGVHVKMPSGVELLCPAPIMKEGSDLKPQPSLSEFLMGAHVVSVEDDSITVELFVPNNDGKVGCVMEKCIPSGLILSIDNVKTFESEMPQVTRQVRAPAPSVLLK